MKSRMRALAAGLLYIFCNYFINIIPCWTIRKWFYRLCGMKIGRHSRIMMKTIVTIPWKIAIGNYTIINENCYLDGRGGLTIGNNVNIALYSMVITGTHNQRTAGFDYYTEPVIIEDNVWLGARSMVLNGCILKKDSIIGAGSVVFPRTECQEKTIYVGVPAKAVKKYESRERLSKAWRVYFR